MKLSSKWLMVIFLIVAISFISVVPIHWIYVNAFSPRLIGHRLDGNIVLRLPETTKVTKTPIGDRREVISSLYFSDEKQAFRGYAQLWRIDDLERFLVASRAQSTFDFKSYRLNRIRIGNLSGFVVEWTAAFGDFYYISGKEYWLKKDVSQNVLRVSFFVDKPSFSENQLNLIDQIIKSIRWPDR